MNSEGTGKWSWAAGSIEEVGEKHEETLEKLPLCWVHVHISNLLFRETLMSGHKSGEQRSRNG